MNTPGHVNNIVDGLNATGKFDLKEQMELIGQLSSNEISNIGMLPSAPKDVSVKFADQFIHIINDKYSLNGLKSSTKIQKRESLLKYQSRFYRFQSIHDFYQRGMKMQWNNKMFPSLNFIHGK